METNTKRRYLNILLRHFYKVNNMLMSEDFIMSENETRKKSLVNRYMYNYRLIKRYLINCVKQNKKSLLDLYDIPTSIIKQLYRYSNIDSYYGLKSLLNNLT